MYIGEKKIFWRFGLFKMTDIEINKDLVHDKNKGVIQTSEYRICTYTPIFLWNKKGYYKQVGEA